MSESPPSAPVPVPAAVLPADPHPSTGLNGPRRSPRRWAWRVVSALLLLVVLALVIAAGVAWWVLNREDGLLAAAQRVPGLQIVQPQGKLDGGPFQAQRIEWRLGDASVVAEDVRWQNLGWTVLPHAGAWASLVIDGLGARKVTINTGPRRATRTAPTSLRLPIALKLPDVHVQSLTIDALPEWLDVRARLHLGDQGGATHSVEQLEATVQRVRVQVRGRIGADAPLPVALDLQAATIASTTSPWRGEGRIDGPLDTLKVDAQVQAQDARLGVQTQLQPFAPWPLQSLDATLRDVNLNEFSAALPVTQLQGKARLMAPARDAPFLLKLSMANASPGVWDAQRLPVQRVQITAGSSLDKPDEVSLRQFDVLMIQGAGRVSGTGTWLRHDLDLRMTTHMLRPSGLDRRLAAMTLSGPLGVKLRGVPSATSIMGRASASGATTQPPVVTGELEGRLSGRLDAPGTPAAEVNVDASGTWDRAAGNTLRLNVGRLDASAAGARAQAKGTAERDANTRWTLKGEGALNQFDPLPWFPGAPGTPWREGKHRFDGRWRADLAWPSLRHAATVSVPAWRLARGVLQLDLADSRLAGVTLQGAATWRNDEGTLARLDARLQSGDNVVTAQGTASRDARDDRWQTTLQAPRLMELAPLARLHPQLATWMPRTGSARGEMRMAGRWPQMDTQGTLALDGVQTGAWRAGQARATWRFNTAAGDQAPLSLNLVASDVSQREGERFEPRVKTLSADVEGTLASHRLTLEAASPVRPPRWGEALAGDNAELVAASRRGTSFVMHGLGSWVSKRDATGTSAGAASGPRSGTAASSGALAQGGTWRAQLTQAEARSRTAPSGPAWFSARDLRVELGVSRDGALTDIAAAPGSARVLNADLSWSQARWFRDAGPTAPAALNLDARLEPLQAAPLLARVLPGYGFGGNLQVGGQIVVRTTPQRFDVDAVIERRGGDLTLTDEGVTQPLGLSDLRLALSAQDGTWHFTQALAGTNLGVLAGAQTVRVPSATRWPSSQTPLEGVLSWRMDNLTALAPWMPPGWRLGGSVSANASIGGRFGAPAYTGRVTGTELAVRNILDGVDVRDGVLDINLRGDDARIDRFVLRGGDGELRIGGGATFGETPALALKLDAQRFQALGRVDRRLVASGQVDLRLRGDQLQVDGKLAVDEGLVDLSRRDAPALDSDVRVVRATSGATADAPDSADRLASANPQGPEAEPSGAAPATRRGPLRNPAINLQVALGDKLRLKGRGIDTLLKGSLALTSPGGRLAVSGDVRAEGGTYTAYGQNLAITRGVLSFNGAVDNPRLDIVAERPNLDVRAGVSIVGTALNPRVRLFSEPEMSDTDKLSWLMLGRAPEGLGRADTALLQRAALAIWAGEDGESPSDALLKTIGLDEFSLRQTESGDVRETVVRVGKQIGRRWYVGYERGVNSATGTWQVIYRVAQRFTVRAQSGADNSLDGIWTWRWN